MSKKTPKNLSNSSKNIRRRRRRLDRHTGLDWIDPERGYGVVRGEQALWRAVILQMLEDAASQSKKPQDKFDREQARHWLEGNNKDFYMVCDLAGYDITYVRMQVKRALLNHCKWRQDKKSKSSKAKKNQQEKISKQGIERAKANQAEPRNVTQEATAEIVALHPFLKKSA